MDYRTATLDELLDRTASERAAPAGGSTAAVVAAVGAALCETGCVHTLGRAGGRLSRCLRRDGPEVDRGPAPRRGRRRPRLEFDTAGPAPSSGRRPRTCLPPATSPSATRRSATGPSSLSTAGSVRERLSRIGAPARATLADRRAPAWRGHLRGYRRLPTTLRADTLVGDAVDRFRDDDRALALVSDADEGTVVGLIAATDTLEAVTGEIEDPLDVTRRERGNASR